MATLYFLRYNNKFNRLVKRLETAAEYIPFVVGEPLTATNFNPADGIRTVHIVNWAEGLSKPDYCIALLDDGSFTRWYVTECTRLRGGQYRFSLERDVLAEYLTEVKASTCLIERGYVPNTSPFVFNGEGTSFNQVKTAETLLTNNIGSPWLCLYLSRYHTDEDTGEYAYNEYEGSFIDESATSSYDYELTSLSDYTYYGLSTAGGSEYGYVNDSSLRFHSYVKKLIEGYSNYYRIAHNDVRADGAYYATGGTSSSSTYPIWDGSGPAPVYTLTTDEAIATHSTLLTFYHTGDTLNEYGLPVNSYSGLGTEDGVNTLLAESGKTIHTSDGKTYRIVVNASSSYDFTPSAVVSTETSLGIQMTWYLLRAFGVDVSGYSLNLQVEWNYNSYAATIEFVEVAGTSNAITYDISYEGAVTTDAVYEILACPLRDVMYTDGSTTFNHIGSIGLQWFQDIINRYNGAGWAYDLQVVPYMPTIYDTTNITNLQKVYCTQSSVNMAVAFKINQASFSLQYNLELDTLNTDNKISNETQLYRFVSPGGVGEYDFSPAMNGGLTAYEVDCTLIPYNPYIKVNPVFSGLYGSDFNDYRGLILGGDFSMPILNDAWTTYTLNNKNYQAIFDRQIQTQQLSNSMDLANNIASTITGALGAAGTGALLGSMIPLVGTGLGAVGGFALSLGAGIADTITSTIQNNESIQSQTDIFNMQLANIQAQAQSMTRSTAYNINNKYFPYVEYYTCTDEELAALEKKIEYQGYALNGVAGVVEDYLHPSQTSFFKGDLLEIDIADDAHTAHAIANELKGGVRFYYDGNTNTAGN